MAMSPVLKLSKASTAGRRPAPASRRSQRGAASLVVVMLLFFLMALVAAYASRNLIFEQRTSANQYRYTQAFEAAEAGLNWALAQLNGGRIDANCVATGDLNATSFRARYIEDIDAQGRMTIKTRTPAPGAETVLLPSCVFDPSVNDWACNCPADAAPSLPAVAASALPRPMFSVRLEYLNPAPGTRRDAIRLVSVGCSRLDASCLSANPRAPGGDAMAVLSTVVALRSAMSTIPGAALTARGSVDGGAGPLRLVNNDVESGGLTVLAGGAVAGGVFAISLPGTPPEASIIATDARLGSHASGTRMFNAYFGMSPDMHRTQPGAVVLNCATGCDAAAVNAELARNPGKALWLLGDLEVDGNIGASPVAGGLAASEQAAARPALLVVTGNVNMTAGEVHGAIYSRAANWNRGAGNTQVFGALLAEGQFSGAGAQEVVYDAGVLAELRTRTGSFVRVPSGWRDF